MPEGSVMYIEFELAGQGFGCINGGDMWTFSPALSLSVTCDTEAEIDALREKLSEGGKVMMELQEYPFSKKYGRLEDKYGLSRQLNMGESKQKITPSLMFVKEKFGKAEEAMNYYCSLFKDSKIDMIARYEEGEGDEVGKIKFSSFTLEDQQFFAMESSGPHEFTFTGAFSLLINCKDQAEIDYFRNSFADGGAPSQCGWINDKFGVTRQVNRDQLDNKLADKDLEKAKRTMEAMLTMEKLDVATLEKAYN